MSRILITAIINPDLDGVACAYAYAELLNTIDKDNEYVAGIYGTPHNEARFILDRFDIKSGFINNPTDDFDKFILVDASDIQGMPEIIRREDVIEVIDHREVHRAPELFPGAKIQIEKIGAAATIIFEKMKENNFIPSRPSILLLLGAIYSNTLNFQSDLAGPRDQGAAELLQTSYGVDIPANFIVDMFNSKTQHLAANLEATIISDFRPYDTGLGIAQLEGFNMAEIVDSKLTEIKAILNRLKEKHSLKLIFLTVADIKASHNIFVVVDDETRNLLTKSLGLVFDGEGRAENDKLLLRKQIIPLLG